MHARYIGIIKYQNLLCSYFAAAESQLHTLMSYFVIRNRDKSLKKAGSEVAISSILENANILMIFVEEIEERYCPCLPKLHAQVDDNAVAKGVGSSCCDNFDYQAVNSH